MSKYTILALLTFVLLANVAPAEGKKFGAGIIVGETTGLTAKTWLDGSRAIAAAGSWSSGGTGTLQLHVDYLIHNYKLLRELAPRTARSRLSVYYGVGARAKINNVTEGVVFDDDVDLGVRFPLGISYRFRDAPLGAFVEIVPTMDLSPDSTFRWRSAFGVRYYFK